MKNVTLPIDEVILAGKWEKRHNIHKYWGKKPANIVTHYIDYYTNKGDTVLDPFSGYGVTIIEAIKNERKAIGYDINPISKLIVSSVLNKAKPENIELVLGQIEKEMVDEVLEAYTTKCPSCDGLARIQSTVWEKDIPVLIKFNCPECKAKGEKKLDEEDLNRIKQLNEKEIPFWYPKGEVFEGWQTKKLKRAGLTYFHEIFTHRNLYVLSAIFDKISKIEDIEVKECFLVSFTSMVAQASKLIADFKGKSGGPSWKINTYWLPENWQELNVWHYFKNRVKKTILAKNEVISEFPSKRLDFNFYLQSSTCMNQIEDNTIDYIFTDPPYGGEGIQYLELSYIWNSWLEHYGDEISWAEEVIHNPHRPSIVKKDHYKEQLYGVLNEAYRVLKPGAWMSLTFANKDLEIWSMLIEGLRNAGFALKSIIPMEVSAPNVTQMLKKNTSKTDLIINVQKMKGNQMELFMEAETFDFSKELENILEQLLETSENIKLSELSDKLIIAWFTSTYSESHAMAEKIAFNKKDIEMIMDSKEGFHKKTFSEGSNQGDVFWEVVKE